MKRERKVCIKYINISFICNGNNKYFIYFTTVEGLFLAKFTKQQVIW